jgi:succinate dehydrogenase flavin-adding protein (antitoxin of CptAB toxin-antitoxin module)
MMIVRGDGPETLDRETVLEVVERLLGKDDDDLYDMLADHVSRVVNLHERIMARDVAKVRN